MKSGKREGQNSARQKAIHIVRVLTKLGHVAYFAGGCVRDMVMRREAVDFDIATTATPDQVIRAFEKCVPVGKQFGVMIVVLDKSTFEVSTFRSEGPYRDGRHPSSVHFTMPEKDALRRDFTINGLFYDPLKKKVIDFVGGREDISKRCIRTIGNPEERFLEDKLRLLRAVRFAANLDFFIDSAAWTVLGKLHKEIRFVSIERIRDELVKMFTRGHAGRALELLSESGLLGEILPEIERMKGVRQPPEFHPEGDVFTHTKLLMERLEKPSVELAFGALLHDVGKPPAYSEEGGKIHFQNHAPLGAEIARKILKRLRFPNRTIDRVAACVENHMNFANVKEMRVGTLKRFIASETFPIELELHRIDCLASHGNLDLHCFLKQKTKDFKAEELKPKPMLNGYDLIGLGIRPGPVMKEVLQAIYHEQLDGKIRTRQEAFEWVNIRYGKNKTEGNVS